MKVLALIPARSGSKSIPDKNIRTVGGKPLFAHSIAHAKSAESVDRIIVSTDSPEYAQIARQFGAETPFLRPAAISGDLSTDLELFQHALKWLDENEGYKPDICVHLRPTYPVRDPNDIDKAIKILEDNPAYDSVRSIAPSPHTPYKMWNLGDDGLITPLLDSDIPEAYNQARQSLPEIYIQNACIDAVRYSVIMEKSSMTGDKIYGYPMDHFYDIDDENDLMKLETYFSERLISASTGKLIFCFDIDGVIAAINPDLEYNSCLPITGNIDIINSLYDQGHTIKLYTARGSATGIDWRKSTESQLERWGVRYHEFHFGKPSADFYIDDKFLNFNQLKKILSGGK